MHTRFGFVDKVAKGIHFQRAVKICRKQAPLKVGNDGLERLLGHGGEINKYYRILNMPPATFLTEVYLKWPEHSVPA